MVYEQFKQLSINNHLPQSDQSSERFIRNTFQAVATEREVEQLLQTVERLLRDTCDLIVR